LRRKLRTLDVEVVLGVDIRRARLEIEAADKHILAVEHDGLGVKRGLGRAGKDMLADGPGIRAQLVVLDTGLDELVVHAVVDAVEVGDELQGARLAVGEGVEDADPDVGVGVSGGDCRIASGERDVIDQKTYPSAAVDGPDQAFGEYTASVVAS
jgi:hypothetical protein